MRDHVFLLEGIGPGNVIAEREIGLAILMMKQAPGLVFLEL